MAAESVLARWEELLASGAFAMLQSPTRPARFQDYWVAAQLVNADLHRRARAQTGVEKN